MTIKHIVLPGGGPNILYLYGAIKYLSIHKIWNLKNINSFHATSAGALLAVILSLNVEWDDIDNYLINRPWNKITNLSPENIINIFSEKGILDKNVFHKLFQPLLNVKDISNNVSLLEFYNKTGIELNLYTTELNEFKSTCLSYKNYPDMLLIDAVYCSCALPPLFKPIINETKCYFDGGVFNNYPLLKLISDEKIDNDEILAINIIYNNSDPISEDSNIGEYFYYFMQKILEHNNKINKSYNLKYEVEINIENTTLAFWYNIISDSKIRLNTILKGEESAKAFLQKVNI